MTYRGHRIDQGYLRARGEGRYYLVLLAHRNRGCEWQLCDYPGTTNMSRESRLHGWLGTTNGLSKTAYGCVEVYPDDQGRMCLREIPDMTEGGE